MTRGVNFCKEHGAYETEFINNCPKCYINNDKKYWYCFSFFGTALTGEENARASTYTGYSDQRITMPRLKHAKAHAGVKNDSVLVSCSYMGYMTKTEMLGDE